MRYQTHVDQLGTIRHWVDADLCVVLDEVTGEPQRFGSKGGSIGTLEEALAHCKAAARGYNDRYVIVRLSCIKAVVCGQMNPDQIRREA